MLCSYIETKRRFLKAVMGVRNAGEDYPLDDDSILKINSPQKKVGGPYVVVGKSVKPRFAIVAMDWDKKHSLGIRWFYDNCGYPNSHGYSTWLMAPEFVKKYFLSQDTESNQLIQDFLEGKIQGEELRNPPNGDSVKCLML